MARGFSLSLQDLGKPRQLQLSQVKLLINVFCFPASTNLFPELRDYGEANFTQIPMFTVSLLTKQTVMQTLKRPVKKQNYILY